MPMSQIYKTKGSISFSGSNVSFNPSVLAELLDTPSNKICLKGTEHRQRRKHRKRRINKKWAKRYGYREVDVDYGEFNAEIKQSEESGLYQATLTRDGD